jgi:hypothetical protein
MDIVVSIVSSVVSAILVFILQSVIRENRKLKKQKDEETLKRETALENGVRQLLCVRLEEIYDQYSDFDSMPRRAYDRWIKLHSAYKGLHGNGTFDHMKLELEEKHIISK